MSEHSGSTTNGVAGHDTVAALFAAGGENGALMAAVDWGATSLGEPEQWPLSLRTAVSVCLESRFPMLIWWGPELVMIYNDSYRGILGAAKHPSAMGQAGADCWPEIWDVIGPMLRGVLEEGAATWSEDQLLLLDRNVEEEECYFTFSYSPIRDEAGGVGGVFTAVFETTERVVGERRMRCLRELAEARADVTTTTQAVQRTAEILSRFPSDIPFACLYILDAVGTAEPGAFVGPGSAVPAQAWPLKSVIAARAPVEIADVSAVPADRGGPEPPATRALAIPIFGRGQGEVTAVLVCGLNPRRALDAEYRSFLGLVAEDLAAGLSTARSREAERHQADALAALNDAKTRFFSNVSHEFRTPLTLLLGPLEDLLADDATLGDRTRETLLLCRRNALRMRRLVNALLDLSQAERGFLAPTFRQVDLAAYTRDLASAFRSAIEAAGLELRIECSALPADVWVDVGMWEKIVLNLLSNALKHTWEGAITVALSGTETAVELRVIDTGIGIPADELPHLFERFHQVRGVSARSAEGSGIGLSLVDELVRLHRGTVAADSEVGRGSVFTVRMPVRQPADARAAGGDEDVIGSASVAVEPFLAEAERWAGPDPWTGQSPAVTAGAEPGARGRVLVVDDNADMRRYLCDSLEAHFDVHAAANGATALPAIAEFHPDLILTDVMMPELDGFGLLAAVRGDPELARLPVIMLTARAGDESSVDGLNAGADDYLVKPFSRPELVARVRANLNASRVREQATREAARRAEQLERLVDVGLRITARLEPEDVLTALAGEARALFGARSADVTDELGNRHTCGEPPSGEDEQLVPIVSEAISATVALTLRLAPSADFDGEQRALAAQLALVGAGALERARLHAAERDTVRRLQESLLPRRLPAVPDLQLAVRYLPAADIAAVGGDWYDVVALPDERLALVVGDVVGHGLGAAATMSSLRNVLRAFLIEGEGAAQALLRMHLLADRAGAGLTATICCVILDPHTGAASWASAGHPPPLRVTAAGAAAYVLAGANQQPALGVGAPAAARDTCFTLSPGDTLLLYTDGLIEPPDRSDGYLALPGLAGRRAPDLDAYCDELIDRLAPSGSRRDDVALLALRRDIAGFD